MNEGFVTPPFNTQINHYRLSSFSEDCDDIETSTIISKAVRRLSFSQEEEIIEKTESVTTVPKITSGKITCTISKFGI